jgi:hypothetical protein
MLRPSFVHNAVSAMALLLDNPLTKRRHTWPQRPVASHVVKRVARPLASHDGADRWAATRERFVRSPFLPAQQQVEDRGGNHDGQKPGKQPRTEFGTHNITIATLITGRDRSIAHSLQPLCRLLPLDVQRNRKHGHGTRYPPMVLTRQIRSRRMKVFLHNFRQLERSDNPVFLALSRMLAADEAGASPR